jgi:hypothetical protein
MKGDREREALLIPRCSVARIKLHCPSCNAALKVDEEKVTPRTRCPRCGSALTLPAQRETVAEEEGVSVSVPDAPRARPQGAQRQRPRRSVPEYEEDEGEEQAAPEKRYDERTAWKKVRLGLLLLLISSGAHLGWTAINWLGWWAFPRLLFSSLWGYLWTFTAVYFGIALAALAGYALLTYTPPRYGERFFIYTVLVIAGICIVYWVVLFFAFSRIFSLAASPKASAATQAVLDHVVFIQRLTLLMIPMQLLEAVQMILLPVFLRQIAHAMEDAQSENHCESIIKWTGLVLLMRVIGPLLSLLPLGALMQLLPVLHGIGMIGFVQGIAIQIVYILLAIGLRETIADHARHLRPRRKKRKDAAPPAGEGAEEKIESD